MKCRKTENGGEPNISNNRSLNFSDSRNESMKIPPLTKDWKLKMLLTTLIDTVYRIYPTKIDKLLNLICELIVSYLLIRIKEYRLINL